MYKTRLVSSLQTLSKKELQQFQLFVSSPFYNKNTRLITFIDALIPYAPDFVSKRIDRKYIYQKLFPNQVFDEQKLRLETSSLFQLFKEYLSTISYQNDPYQKQTYLLEELRQRNNERVFQSELKAWENNLDKSDKLNSQKYFAQYRLYAEKNVFFGQQFLRKYNPSLQNKVDNFDLYFLTIKLKETCEMLNRQAFIKPGYQIRMADELIKALAIDSFYIESSPLIAVYYTIYQMLSEPDESKHFQELTHLLALHHHKFEKHESRGIFKQAQNYCIRQINREQYHYLSEIFSLYQQQLESQLIMFEGNISPTDFKNIVTVGLRLKKFPWVESFLLEYGPKIHSEHRESIFNFNTANFLVSSGDNKAAIKLLQTVKFTDPYIQISARQLLLKVFYEEEDINTMLYHLDAFMIFIRRNKNISNTNRQSLLNSLKLQKKLILLKDKEVSLSGSVLKTQLLDLKKKLNETKELPDRKWILEKIAELLGEK